MGAPVAEQAYAECAAGIARLNRRGSRAPGLAFILVGRDPASHLYVKRKRQACRSLGISGQTVKLPADVSQRQLLERIGELNRDEAIDGILVQQPLPQQIDTGAVVRAVDPAKDVDGFHPHNLGELAAGSPDGLRACTPKGIMRLLAAAGIDPAGRHALVIGRSLIVGRPMALMLINAHATVTVCNSRTRPELLAAGCRNLVCGDMVKPGAAVIDVGLNRDERGLLCGDTDFESVREVAGHITPVPGGVGPMTVAMLMANTVQAALAADAARAQAA